MRWRRKGCDKAVIDLIKTLVPRLSTNIVLQLMLIVAVGYIVASLWEVDFWLVVAISAIPILAWHGVIKQYRDTVIQQREEERERRHKEEAIRRRAISQACASVEEAYKLATTRTLNGVLNPALTGEYYDDMMYARNATDSVASFIKDPPAPLGEATSAEHPHEWLVVLRKALRER